MSRYCTITDVNAYVPQQPFTAATVPNQAQVEIYIQEISDVIDASLVLLGYVVPITGEISLRQVRYACAKGALGLAQQARYTAVKPDEKTQLSVWTIAFQAWLKDLGDPMVPYQLPDAAKNSKEIIQPIGEMQRDPTISSIDSGTAQDPTNYLYAPTFRIGMKF